MKKTVFTIFLTFIFLSNSYLSTCFAQENMVRLIYFFPSDSVPQPNIDTKLDALIKKVQQIFTGQMEHYGFGSKTFQFETDETGKAVVHRVKGKFKDVYYHNRSHTVWDEINEQFDLSNNIYFTALEVSTELLDGSACGRGGPRASGGTVLIPASGGCFDGDFGVDVAAHELGHAFGLIHDFRNNLIPWVNSYTNDPMVTSFCAAEWLDAHPYFNADSIYANAPTKVKMLPPRFVSAPSTVRIRFEVTDPDGLHQAQLQARADIHGDIQLLDCQSLSGESGVVEFVTTATDIRLAIMDANGNDTFHQFSIDISDLISVPSKVISILDTNLQREIRGTLGLASNEDITTHAMLKLTSLMAYNKEIKDITGLEHALNLTWIDLRESPITDLSPLTALTQLKTLQLWNTPISDFSVLTGLTELQRLELGYTTISDLSPLAALTELQHLDLRGNPITDLSPLTGLTQLKTLQLWNTPIVPILDFSVLTMLTQLQRLELGYTTISDLSPLAALTELQHLDIRGNPLSYTAINTDIPALQAKGISVQFDNVAHPALLKFSGDGQTSEVGTTLAAPFVVEAMDRYGKPIQGVPVTFAITTGDGRLSTEITTTDATGKAQTTLTFGDTHSTYVVTATAIQITQSVVTFTAFAGEAPRRSSEDVNDDGVVNILDLVLIASSFGQTGETAADINGDGVINIQDLVLVAAALGNVAAAPSLHPDTLKMLTVSDVRQWLSQAQGFGLTDLTSQKGIHFLEQLLATLIPKETALLANYPNPLNPETWIPYQLSEPTNVRLTLYDINGRVVRDLDLGHQRAGKYESRSRAAYWDGRNAVGESVASGVYFYTLTAGEFTATRRMLILK